MATVTIEDAKVFKIIEGYGFRAVEEFKLRNGEDAKRYFTIWTDQRVEEGQVFTISGDLSVKIEEYTNRDNEPKTSAAVHVNNAKLKADAPF
jgi:hypothetical protein